MCNLPKLLLFVFIIIFLGQIQGFPGEWEPCPAIFFFLGKTLFYKYYMWPRPIFENEIPH